MSDVRVHTVNRLSAEAPIHEAEIIEMTEGYAVGDEFIIQRRVGFPVRWDACVMEITTWGPSMVQVGFGFTKRAARRKALRDTPFRLRRSLAQGDPS